MSTVNDGSVVWQVCRYDEAQTLQGLTADNIKTKIYIASGTFVNEVTVPLPSGYNRSQCKYIAWENTPNDGMYVVGNVNFQINQATGSIIGYEDNGNDYNRLSTIANSKYHWNCGYIVIAVKNN